MLSRLACISLATVVAAAAPGSAHARLPERPAAAIFQEAAGFLPSPLQVGATGMVAGQFDDDPWPDVAFTASQAASVLVTVGFDGAGYGRDHYLKLPAKPTSLKAWPGVDGQLAVVVGDQYPSTSAARLLRIGGRPLRILESITLPAQAYTAAELADTDADGDLEFIAAGGGQVQVFDFATLTPQWTAGSGGSNFAIGQLDGDAALEIIVADSSGSVVDGLTRMNEWTYAGGYAGRIAVGNLDGDPAMEYVTAPPWTAVVAFDTSPYTPAWEVPNFNTANVGLFDIDNSGRDELVIGDAQWGTLRVYDTMTRAVLHTVPNPEHGVSSFTIANLDAAGPKEIVWGAGLSSGGEDRLAIASLVSPYAAVFAESDEGGPFVVLGEADVDADGTDEVAFVSPHSDSGYSGPRFHLLSAGNFKEEAEGGPSGPWSFRSASSAAMANVDADAALEILIAIQDHVWVLDGASRALERDIVVDGIPAGLRVLDADGDSDQDLFFCTYDGGMRANILDLASGALAFRTVGVGAAGQRVDACEIGQFDADPAFDMALGNRNGVWVFDATSKALDWSLGLSTSSIAVADNGATRELLLLESNDYMTLAPALRSLDFSTRTVLRTTAVPWEGGFSPRGPFVQPLGGRADRVLVAVRGGLRLVDTVAGRIWAQVDEPGYGTGAPPIVTPAGDDRWAVLIGNGTDVRRLLIEIDSELFAHGFE